MATRGQQRQQSWTVDDIFEHRFTVIGLLFVLIVCVAVILWLLFSMSRYEREGDELMGKMKYQDAADKYVKALQRHTFSGKDRLMFKLGQVHASLDEEERAVDFLFQLMKDFPEDNYYHIKAKALAANLLSHMTNGPIGEDKPDTTLGAARATYRRSYQKLLRVLIKGMHKEGNRNLAKRLYQQYKTSHERYQNMIKKKYPEAVKRRADERQKRLEERNSGMDG